MSQMTREAGTDVVMQVVTCHRVQAVVNGVAWVPQDWIMWIIWLIPWVGLLR
jgi:hypothetical protein